MNAEATLKWPEKINDALITIKDALRQVHEVNAQLEAARKLSVKRPELTVQLELAEQFYIARRKALLDLEGPVSTLAGIREALATLLERAETERLTLEGRILLAEQSLRDGNKTTSIQDDIKSSLAEVTQRCEKISLTIHEIREVLQEYSLQYSKPHLKPDYDENQGLKQLEAG
jgi:chromosome segregation ATPase